MYRADSSMLPLIKPIDRLRYADVEIPFATNADLITPALLAKFPQRGRPLPYARSDRPTVECACPEVAKLGPFRLPMAIGDRVAAQAIRDVDAASARTQVLSPVALCGGLFALLLPAWPLALRVGAESIVGSCFASLQQQCTE